MKVLEREEGRRKRTERERRERVKRVGGEIAICGGLVWAWLAGCVYNGVLQRRRGERGGEGKVGFVCVADGEIGRAHV